ncbi:hypothetical protein AVEN_164671-1 [Araneus ventricosus]|uniref:Uncharacterized protein n=1 Tax=Araneus ventricosus TaxID=182803 RepID=A0A4Y2XAE5_ARAVE|nr:hypothetical protein AVEN_164671-1 [Araneus ventricosus]
MIYQEHEKKHFADLWSPEQHKFNNNSRFHPRPYLKEWFLVLCYLISTSIAIYSPGGQSSAPPIATLELSYQCRFTVHSINDFQGSFDSDIENERLKSHLS